MIVCVDKVATLKKTRHENLVLFMGACMTPPKLAIVTRLVAVAFITVMLLGQIYVGKLRSLLIMFYHIMNLLTIDTSYYYYYRVLRAICCQPVDGSLICSCKCSRPPSNLVNGQELTMCDIVWISPQSHSSCQ